MKRHSAYSHTQSFGLEKQSSLTVAGTCNDEQSVNALSSDGMNWLRKDKFE